MLEHLDYEKRHKDLQQRLITLIPSIFNIESTTRKLEVSEVQFNGLTNSSNYMLHRQLRDQGGTLAQDVSVKVKLFEKATDKLINESRKVNICKLPVVTARLSYLVQGREYQVSSQFRRMSGIYTRIADNGEIQAVAANERKGQIPLVFDPIKRMITIQPKLGSKDSSATLDLYALLRGIGKTDEQIASVWGQPMVDAAKRNIKPASMITSLISKAKLVAGDKAIIPNERVAAEIIFQELAKHTLDTRITQDVLGRPHATLTPDALLDTGKALIQVSKGEKTESSYNNIGHKKFLDTPDLIEDYLARKAREIQQKVKNRMGVNSDSASKIVSGIMDPYMLGFFRKGGETQLSSEGDQINPVAMISGATTTTVKGMGGISTGPGMQLGSATSVHSSHLAFLDPLDTGESDNTGLVLPLATGTAKEGDRLHAMLYSMKTKQLEKVDPLTADRATVAFPEDVEFVNGECKARVPLIRVSLPGGKPGKVALSQVDYVIVNAQQQFGIATNLIPFVNNNNGNRNMMAAKMAGQSLSLVNREEPLIQIRVGNTDNTMEKAVGSKSAELSPVNGVVTEVTDDFVKINDGKEVHTVYLYNNFQTNAVGGVLQHTPIVKVGDKVKEGQLVADSNFTKNGTLALGTNLRVGYLPMRGYNYEDGVVISRSASEKLKSEHMYSFDRDATVQIGTKISPSLLNDLESNAVIISRYLFDTIAPQSSRLSTESFKKLDENGIIKLGEKVEMNDVLICAVTKKVPDPTFRAMSKSTSFALDWKASEVRWEKETPGVVSRIVNTGKKVTVFVRTQEKMTIGDKLVGRYGNKGIVTKILEDHEMPFYKDASGEQVHLEVALHPVGMTGRTNPGQLMELGASKIAEKTGKPYIVTNFDKNSQDRLDELMKEMQAHGVSDQELLHDPDTGKSIGSVIVGKQYIQKLQHQVEKKFTARAGGSLPGIKGAVYDINHQPVKGAGIGGQAMGALGMYGLLAHNARANILEMQTHHSTYEQGDVFKGEYDSDEYWDALMNGHQIPAPQPTFATKKFFSHLTALGINTSRNADEFQLVPMTDKDVLKSCPHEIENPSRAIVGKTGEPEKGGLFDFPTGKTLSKEWGRVTLHSRVINPVFEKPVCILLDIMQKNFEPTAQGKMPFSGGTGMGAIVNALAKIDTAKELEKQIKLLDKVKGTERNNCVKKIRLLKVLTNLNLSAYDAYTMKYMPILPPVMRPIGISDAVDAVGDVKSADINQMYRQVGMFNMQLKDLPAETLPEKKMDAEYALFNSVKETYIKGAMDNKGAPISSLLQYITNPKTTGGLAQGKEGFYQDKLIGRRVELSARSVIIPEPNLTLDQIGMPRKMALAIYRPFIIREIIGMGYTPAQAMKKYRDEATSDTVKYATDLAVKSRPVLMKRDPMLHKHSVMAFYPTLTEDKSIQIHPMVCKGFNADFDGDTMAIFLPASQEAVEEAKGMTPSRNLFGAKDFDLMNLPEWDAAYGIWQLSEIKFTGKQVFDTESAAYLAHKQNTLEEREGFKYKGNVTTIGRMKLLNVMPDDLKKTFEEKILFGPNLTKSEMAKMMREVARLRRDYYPQVADALKNLGAKSSYMEAASYGLNDLRVHKDIRDHHLAIADEKLAKIANPTDRDKVAVYGEANSNITKDLKARLSTEQSDNRLWKWTGGSGAIAGKWTNVEQILSAPLQVQDSSGQTCAEPIRKSYSEGLATSDYWNTLPGIRAGTLARVKGTSEPGAKAKDLVNLAINVVVTEDDCGTKNGVSIPTKNIDCEGRYLGEDTTIGGTLYKRNTLMTVDSMKEIQKHISEIKLRSPLTCLLTRGVCKKCQGFNEHGRDYNVGENAGVNAAQSMSEPLTQMAMRLFHSGGSANGAGAKMGNQLDRLSELFEIPQTLRDKAIITTIDGSVVNIKEDEVAGGYFIQIGETEFKIPSGKQLSVKVGDTVKKGQALCDGPINPHELLEVGGMPMARDYLLKEMSQIYGSYGVRQRHVETVLRNLTNMVEIVEDPEFEFVPGEVIARTQMLRTNAERNASKKKLIVAKDTLKRINEAVQVNTENDFLAGLNYQEIRDVITEGAALGAKSNLHGINPLPGIAYGAEFGMKQSAAGVY